MIVDEVINMLEDIRHAYNTAEFDFTKTHSIPMFFLEGAGIGAVSDPETFTRVFDTIVNCNKYLDLTKIEFYPQQFIVLSDVLVIATVRWHFLKPTNEIGLVHEVGYVIQKRDDAWKINVVLQPTWRDPMHKGGRIDEGPEIWLP